MTGLEIDTVAPGTAILGLYGFIGTLQFTVCIATGRRVPSEHRSGARSSRLNEEIGRARRLYVCLMATCAIRNRRNGIVIPQERGRIRGQRLRRILDRIVPVLDEEVITRSKAACGLVVEVILRHGIGGVIDQGDTLLDVLSDHFVDLLERTPVIAGVEVGFGMIHIGDAQIVVGRSRIVGHAEEVGQHKVRVGPAQQGFALAGLQSRRRGSAHLLDGRKGLIGISDATVVGAPDVSRRVVAGSHILRPLVDILVELVIVLGNAPIADVVR